jgi:hypothetical protein
MMMMMMIVIHFFNWKKKVLIREGFDRKILSFQAHLPSERTNCIVLFRFNLHQLSKILKYTYLDIWSGIMGLCQ